MAIRVCTPLTKLKGKLERLQTTDPLSAVGLIAEMHVLDQLSKLNNLVCYHSVKGMVGRDCFEIDVLLPIPPKDVVLLEVKSYSGFLSKRSDTHWHQQKTDGTFRLLKNPFLQLGRALPYLKACFGDC